MKRLVILFITVIILLSQDMESFDVKLSTNRVVSGDSVKVTIKAIDASGKRISSFLGKVSVTSDAELTRGKLYSPAYYIGANPDDAKKIQKTDVAVVIDAERDTVYQFLTINSRIKVLPAQVLGNNWTISVWFKGLRRNGWRSLTRGSATVADNQIYVNDENILGNKAGLIFTKTLYNTDKIEIGTGWHHLAVLGTSGQTQYYIDGEHIGTTNTQSTTDISTIGNGSIGEQFANYLDDFFIYKEALTKEQIAKLYAMERASVDFLNRNKGVREIFIKMDQLGKTSFIITHPEVTKRSKNLVVLPYKFELLINKTPVATEAYDLTVKAKSVSGKETRKKIEATYLTLTSSDKTALLPKTYDFSLNSGKHTFINGVIFTTLNDQTLTITNNEGATDTVHVLVQDGTVGLESLETSFGSEFVKSGRNVTLTIKAKDVTFNVKEDFVGIVTLKSRAVIKGAKTGTYFNPNFHISGSAGGDAIHLKNGTKIVYDSERGYVYKFPNENSFIRVIRTHPLANNWTITAWFKDLKEDGLRGLLFNDTTFESGSQFVINKNSFIGNWDKKGNTFFHNSDYNVSKIGIGWHHIVVTGNSGDTKYYVDGKLVGTTTNRKEGAVFYIGGSSYNNRFARYLDDIAVYDRVLDEGEILELFSSESIQIVFSLKDKGIKTISLALDKLGKRSLEATNFSIRNNPTNIIVTPYSFMLKVADFVDAGDSFNLEVIAKSSSGVVATEKIPGLHLKVSSSDPLAILPDEAHDFGSTVGTYTFKNMIVLVSEGEHFLFVKDDRGARDSIKVFVKKGRRTLTVSLGSKLQTGIDITNYVSKREIYQFHISANALETIYLKTILFHNSGSLDLSKAVSQAILVHDANGNGRYDSSENILTTTKNFTRNSVRFTGNSLDSIKLAMNKSFLVVLNLNGVAAVGKTIQFNLDTVDLSLKTSTTAIRVVYKPKKFVGNKFTINDLLIMRSNTLGKPIVTKNEIDLQVMDMTLSSKTVRSIVTGLTVNLNIGSGQNASDLVDTSILFLDKNKNGIYDDELTDSLLSKSPNLKSKSGDIVFTLLNKSVFGEERWIVQVNLNGNGKKGTFIQSSILSPKYFTLSKGTVSKDNFPLSGRYFTIENLSMNFIANPISPSRLSFSAKDTIEMFTFSLSRLNGQAKTIWKDLRVLNRSEGGKTSASDIQAIELYRMIDEKDTILLGRSIVIPDGNGGYADISINGNMGISIPNKKEIFIIKYELSKEFNRNNFIGLKIERDAFTILSKGNRINNLPYQLAEDISLPVVFSKFEEGEANKNGIEISLRTASEPTISILYILRESTKDGSVQLLKKINMGEKDIVNGSEYDFLDKDAVYELEYRYYLEEHYLSGKIYQHKEEFRARRSVPDKIVISHAYPNPFNPEIQVKLDLNSRSDVTVIIYNSIGQVIQTEKKIMPAGFQNVIRWSGINNIGNKISSGVYFMQIQVLAIKGNARAQRIQKIVLIQ